METRPVTSSFRRNLPVIAGVVALCALIFVIAGQRDDTHQGRKQITFWIGWAGDEQRALQAVVDQYNNSQDKVFVKTVSIAGSYEKMKIAFAGGDTPDICSTVWGWELADYALRDTLTPLDDFMARSGRSREEFAPGIVELTTYQDNVYALSMGVGTNFIAYNKQVFREAGLDPENPPQTAEEFADAVLRTTRYRNNDPAQGIERLGFSFSQSSFFFAAPFGVEFWDAEKQEVLPYPERLEQTLAWVKSLVDQTGGLQKQRAFASGFGSTTSVNNPFISGKVAMVRVGDWYASVIGQYAPKDFEWGWFALPYPEKGGRRHTTLIDGSMFVIPRASRHKEEAWDFLNFIISEHGISEFRLDKNVPNSPPSLRSMYDRREYQTPYWQFAISLLESPQLVPPPEMPGFYSLFNEVNRAEEQVLSGARSPREAVADVKERMQRSVDAVLGEPRSR